MVPPALPTPSQLNHLLTLQIPSALPSPPSPSAHLSPILSLLRTDWIRSFLLTPDPIHLPYLSSPTLSQNALTLSTTTTRAAPATPLPAHETIPETHHLRGRTLYLPAFTLSSTTAGFGVWDCANHLAHAGPFPLWQPGCSDTVTFRFVRDHATRAQCELYDSPNTGCVLLVHTARQTPTLSTSTTLLFHRDTMRALVNPDGPVPPAQSLVPAMLFLQIEDLHHACTECGATACACEYASSSEQPRHPFDAAFFKRSMAPLLGVHTSTANKLSFLDGAPRHLVLATRVTCEGLIDPGFVRDARAWVVSSHHGRTPPDPRHSAVRVECPARAAADDSVWEELGLVQHAVEDGAGGDCDILNEFLIGIPDDVLITELPQEHLDEPRLDDLSLPPSERASLHTASQSHAAEPQSDRRNAQEAHAASSAHPCTAVGDHGVQGDEPGTEETNQAREVESASSPFQPSCPAEVLGGTAADSNHSVAILDNDTRSIADSQTHESVPNEANREAELLAERRVKAQLRRERNRAAAQRSNMKRKFKRESLISDLEDIRERVRQLREKEVSLRQENLKLRRTVGSKE